MLILLIVALLVLFLSACSEEDYCEQPYIMYYQPIQLWNGAESFEPVYGCLE